MLGGVESKAGDLKRAPPPARPFRTRLRDCDGIVFYSDRLRELRSKLRCVAGVAAHVHVHAVRHMHAGVFLHRLLFPTVYYGMQALGCLTF